MNSPKETANHRKGERWRGKDRKEEKGAEVKKEKIKIVEGQQLKKKVMCVKVVWAVSRNCKREEAEGWLV